MAVAAKLNYLRIAPRKVRLVADAIRGKRIQEALNQLRFSPNRAALPMAKLLESAIANAKNNFQLAEDNLYISKITVDEGPKLKRWRARARGSAFHIQKKTSHIILTLDKIQDVRKIKTHATEPEKAKEVKQIDRGAVENVRKRKFKPAAETLKPKTGGGMKRIFRRKAI